MLFGIAIGWLSLRARHYARDPQVEITLSLITPYLAYWVPEHLGGSGVISTVACGLYISWNGPLLISSATRLQGIFFWNLMIYLIEGLLFLLTGFQMRLLLREVEGVSARRHPGATALVAVIVIVARFVWVYPATYLPRVLSKSLRRRDPSPPWQWVFILSFAGVRGAVSLAAALALPFALPNGDAFPDRDLDPVRRLRRHLHDAGRTWASACPWSCAGSASLTPAATSMIAEHSRKSRPGARRSTSRCSRSMRSSRSANFSDEVVSLLRARHEIRASQLPDSLDPETHDVSAAGTGLTRELIAAERKFIHMMLRDGKITDETRRQIERDLDLEEASLANREYRETPL